MIAIAVFEGKIKGFVRFTESTDRASVKIEVQLSGLKKNAKHGFHIHEAGDLTDKCESLCAHFNPYGKKHGGPADRERHVGDLGNLHADSQGVVNHTFYDSMCKLRGTKCNILGRGLIVHADEDDLGRGANEASLVNGNAGKRIGCAVIGYGKEMFR
jgi:superoxide dismutase, Cu-Zn family